MLFHNLPAIPAPELGLSDWLVAFADLNQPIQIVPAPAVAGYAVEGKGVILLSKVFNCPHADDGMSIAIGIQAIQAV